MQERVAQLSESALSYVTCYTEKISEWDKTSKRTIAYQLIVHFKSKWAPDT